MKVALIVPEFPPDTIGGGGPVFESLAQTLVRRGHGVRVLTSSTYGAPPANDSTYGFEILRIPQLPHGTVRLKTYMPPSPFHLRAARRFLRGASVYHLHGYGSPFVDAIFNFFLESERCVFTTHGSPFASSSRGGLLAAAYRAYDAAIGFRVLKYSRRATAISTVLAREMSEISGRAVVAIPDGFVPLGDPRPLEPRYEAEMMKGGYVLGVGRLEERKGFHFILEALALLCARGIALRLLLAGADYGSELRLRGLANQLGLEGAVSFLGNVARPQLSHLYQRSAAVVVSSTVEPFGLVTLEAMAGETPCVASAAGGMLDVIDDGVNGLLFRAGDAAGLADRLERIVKFPEFRARLTSNGLATVERFSWERVAVQYEELYEECA